jgi:hypothetical protein
MLKNVDFGSTILRDVCGICSRVTKKPRNNEGVLESSTSLVCIEYITKSNSEKGKVGAEPILVKVLEVQIHSRGNPRSLKNAFPRGYLFAHTLGELVQLCYLTAECHSALSC